MVRSSHVVPCFQALLASLFLLIVFTCLTHGTTVEAVPTTNPTITAGSNIVIGGVLPLQAYPCYALAAFYACADVNAGSILSLNSSQSPLLPAYPLRIYFNETLQDSGVTVGSALWLMEYRSVIALIGEVTSGVTEATATLASAFKTPMISPQATVQDFSNKALYPYFSRVVGGDDQQAFALHSMMIYFGWLDAQILYATDTYGTGFAADLQAVASASFRFNGTGVRFSSVNSFASADQNSINAAVAAMVQDGSPIVVLLASRSGDSRKVATAVVSMGILGQYQFVGCDGWFHPGIVAATAPSLLANYTAFLTGVVGTLPKVPSSSAAHRLNQRIANSELDVQDTFLAKQAATCNTTDTTTAYLYDSVLLLANAARKVLDTNQTLSGVNIQQAIFGSRFSGLTGTVQINANGDRVAEYSILNYLPSNGNDLPSVGLWTQYPSGASLTTDSTRGTNPYSITMTRDPTFVNGLTTPPLSIRPKPIKEIMSAKDQLGLQIGSGLFAVALGIIPFLLVINFRDHVAIKTANMPLTLWLLFGVTFGTCFPAILSLSLSPSSSYSVYTTCVLPYLVVAFSFNIIFSALLTKTHYILTLFKNEGLKLRMFDWWTNSRISIALLLADGFLFLLWGVVDKPRITLQEYSYNSDYDYYTCTYSHTLLWQLIIMLPKFGLMALTAAVAWRIREVPHAFNESRWLGLIIYNMLFVASIIILLVNIIHEPLAGIIISSLGVWLCLSATVCLFLIPKLLIIAGYRRSTPVGTIGRGGRTPEDQMVPVNVVLGIESGATDAAGAQVHDYQFHAARAVSAGKAGNSLLSEKDGEMDGSAYYDSQLNSSRAGLSDLAIIHSHISKQSQGLIGKQHDPTKPVSVLELATIGRSPPRHQRVPLSTAGTTGSNSIASTISTPSLNGTPAAGHDLMVEAYPLIQTAAAVGHPLSQVEEGVTETSPSASNRSVHLHMSASADSNPASASSVPEEEDANDDVQEPIFH